ncbi:hypothetical protein APHAL10511_003277 [Amanita phalloides]|nr:hypothetical protein APHAL10511_003277 [Amanita phalloides]
MRTPLLFFIYILTVVSVLFAGATPLKRDADLISDIEMLNFALTMEYLLSKAYKDGLAKYSKEVFANAGFEPFTYGRLIEVAEQENRHAKILQSAVSEAGMQPVPECEYHFTHDNPASFIKTISELEATAASSYCGFQAFLKRKEYSTIAVTILATEARHDAWLDSAVRKFNPWSTAFETPLTRKHAYSIFSKYISSCPTSYPIQLEAFPALSFASAPVPGQRVQIQVDEAHIEGGNQSLASHRWVAFLNGEGIRYAAVHAVNKSFEVTVPNDIAGTVYALLTSSDRKMTDEVTIAGPALLTFPYSSTGNLV